MDPFLGFILIAVAVVGVVWLVLAISARSREKRRNNAQATALASRLRCPRCNLPTLQWTGETWDAELEYLDGTSRLEHGFTYHCVNCDENYDFTTAGDYRQ